MDTTESILTSVKKLLGIDESYTHFDADLIMHINSVFSILGQIGVGPKKGFAISGADEKWSDFLEDDPGRLALVKSYMHLKVRLLFDLPTASSAVDAMNRQISEFEWRLFVAADNAAREEESQKWMNFATMASKARNGVFAVFRIRTAVTPLRENAALSSRRRKIL